ncbi:hypothetical protein COV04_03910 [Candidatus Uhrbacteria bacterium CG10_big_fil_rev_8_21_14_0_10_48_11]|uniref:Uncharacterized protein n=1 Tax=Candidatus Uhrbacteria bacterium CG10_big_fil_rev_8_21_14_0_10_48_11 TaxID=1975037 RepID=A0A2M8LDK1_9BACT|nr:MAG: hypothetical protein COV04_03910 [Candidatus Uhrbacteria bacterium CG10_big_fil_rev_8_21_14_0_10_48_11]
MNSDTKKLVIEEFSKEEAQRFNIEKVNDGLWIAEEQLIKKYLQNSVRVFWISVAARVEQRCRL